MREPRRCARCWEETFRFLTVSYPYGALGADGRRGSRFEDETWVFQAVVPFDEGDVLCDDCFMGFIESGSTERI